MLGHQRKGKLQGWFPCDSGLSSTLCGFSLSPEARMLQLHQTSHSIQQHPEERGSSVLTMRSLLPEAPGKPTLEPRWVEQDYRTISETIPLARWHSALTEVARVHESIMDKAEMRLLLIRASCSQFFNPVTWGIDGMHNMDPTLLFTKYYLQGMDWAILYQNTKQITITLYLYIKL